MKNWLFISLLAFSTGLFAQDQESNKSPLADSTLARIMKVLTYPLIKGYPFAGVIPVADPSEKPDPDLKYKILFELTYNNPDSLSKNPNGGLVEIARVINLHYASGIPLKNLELAIVVHGPSLNTFLTNEAYQKKYKMGNPNLALIKELQSTAGVKLIACGQAMFFFDVPKEDLIPDIKVSLTAQTVISGYLMRGYMLKLIDTLN